MNTTRSAINRYRQILIASVLSSGSFLAVLPALADQNTPAAGTSIENQATAEFTDSADTSTNPTSIKIVSDIVKVTVAEVAGITIGSVNTTGTAYRGNKVFVDFKVYNSGNDPTKIFIPGKPSVAKLGTTDIPAANIGAIKVIGYTTVSAGATPTETFTAISTGNTVSATGSSTGDLTGLTVAPSGGSIAAPGGSIPAGAYITVRVEITVPDTATNGQVIKITLGNTGGTDANNQAYAAATPATDLYTQDHTATPLPSGEVDGVPINGEREASKSQSITVNQVSITGTVWNDKDNSAAATPFVSIKTGTETGTNAVFGTSVIPVYAVLVDMTVPASPIVLQSTTVDATTGVYTFTEVPPNTNVKVLLLPNTTTVTTGSAAPAAALKATLVSGWVGTSATELAFATATSDITAKDFGIRQKAQLVLAKRITKIQDATTNPNDTSKVLTTVITDTFNFNPTKNPGNPATYVGNWPTTPDYLVGLTDAGKVKPDDTIEYTIYFLNNQGSDAKNVKICDRIRGDQTYVPGSLYLKLGDSTEVSLPDSGNTYASTDAMPTGCNSDAATTITGSDNGGIAISPGIIPGVTAVSGGVTTPSGSYGYFRFKTKVATPPPAAAVSASASSL